MTSEPVNGAAKRLAALHIQTSPTMRCAVAPIKRYAVAIIRTVIRGGDESDMYKGPITSMRMEDVKAYASTLEEVYAFVDGVESAFIKTQLELLELDYDGCYEQKKIAGFTARTKLPTPTQVAHLDLLACGFDSRATDIGAVVHVGGDAYELAVDRTSCGYATRLRKNNTRDTSFGYYNGRKECTNMAEVREEIVRVRRAYTATDRDMFITILAVLEHPHRGCIIALAYICRRMPANEVIDLLLTRAETAPGPSETLAAMHVLDYLRIERPSEYTSVRANARAIAVLDDIDQRGGYPWTLCVRQIRESWR